MADLTDEITDLAGKLKRSQSGDKIMEQQSIADLAIAAKTLRDLNAADTSDSAANVAGFGIRFQKIAPPGGGS